jgi:hypothetical protein
MVFSRVAAGRLDFMEHPMKGYGAKDGDGVLVGRDRGEAARRDVERSIRQTASGTPIALDFKGVRSVSVPFADALLVPLLSNRMSGYYEDHPILVVNPTDDVAETLAATLERRGLFILGTPPPRLLGAQPTLEETLQLANELSPFSVLQLAHALGVTQQAANTRLKLLLNSGALVRTRSVPARGGMEFLYAVPRLPARRRKRPNANDQRLARGKPASSTTR